MFGTKLFDHRRLLWTGDLASHVNVPEQRLGKWEVKHDTIKAGETITVVSMRNSIFMGFKTLNVRLDVPLKVTKLLEEGQLWMSTSLQEIFLHHLAVDAARGDRTA